jgi:hypothetical protein
MNKKQHDFYFSLQRSIKTKYSKVSVQQSAKKQTVMTSKAGLKKIQAEHYSKSEYELSSWKKSKR